ncbi:MAG: SMC-Scp complex subunit ScpB, partial [Planctomycetota bacterium]
MRNFYTNPWIQVSERFGSWRVHARTQRSTSSWLASQTRAAPRAKELSDEEKQDGNPDRDRQRVEAALLMSQAPLSPRRLAQVAGVSDATRARACVRELNELYRGYNRALRVENVAGGFQMLTHSAVAPWLSRLPQVPRMMRLSTPMMETLAVVAYRGPVSRAVVESIRGVACGEILRQLIERDLVRIAGRSDELGRPYLYDTTKRFLQIFGLRGRQDLPPVANQTLQEDDSTDLLSQNDSTRNVAVDDSTHETDLATQLSTHTQEPVVTTAAAASSTILDDV